MVLDSKRDSVEFIVAPVARAFSRFNPNTISWLSFILAVAAGISIFFSPKIALGAAPSCFSIGHHERVL